MSDFGTEYSLKGAKEAIDYSLSHEPIGWTYISKFLYEQLAAERAKVALAVDALEDISQWAFHGSSKVACKALAALQSTDALADIRREAARECAEEADNFAKSQDWGSDGERASMKIADAIRAKFGVKP